MNDIVFFGAPKQFNFQKVYISKNINWNVCTSTYGIDLVTVFEAILTSRQTRGKLQCLYENLMCNNFRKTAILKNV